MWPVCRRRSEFSTAVTIQRREAPWWLGSSPIGRLNLVARTTLSRRPLSALPTATSDSPYASAVSMKLIPASSALWMMRAESSWSGLPMDVPSASAQRNIGSLLEAAQAVFSNSRLDAAAATGEIRADISARDLLRAVALLCTPVSDEGIAYSQRMVTLLIDGLRYAAELQRSSCVGTNDRRVLTDDPAGQG